MQGLALLFVVVGRVDDGALELDGLVAGSKLQSCQKPHISHIM